MAENSSIEWTDHTFNPWIGCAKVSDGCKHCYAEALMDKRYGRVEWGPSGQRVRTSEANWKKPLAWNRKTKAEGRRARVFCASLADWAEVKLDQPELIQWRKDLYELIEATPYLDWLMLTKRIEYVMDILPLRWEVVGIPDNVWIGTSVENQAQADKRIPELLEIPAKVRFLSMEPLLGPVNFERGVIGDVGLDALDWVIVGGESGHGARPVNPDWVRGIRDQCDDALVPFFFKQWGEWAPVENYPNGKAGITRWPSRFERPVTRVGKKAAGRLLDGKEWNEFPLIAKEQTT